MCISTAAEEQRRAPGDRVHPDHRVAGAGRLARVGDHLPALAKIADAVVALVVDEVGTLDPCSKIVRHLF